MTKSNINPNIMLSMMRYDSNKDGKLTGSELKKAVNKFNNSDKDLAKDIVDKASNSKSLTPQDKANLNKLISKSASIEPNTILFDKLSIVKEKNEINLKIHKKNLDIFTGKNSKYVGSYN